MPRIYKTIGEVLDFYRQRHVIPNVVSQKTYAVIEGHLKKYFGKLSVRKLSPHDALSYIDWRNQVGRVKPATVRRELAVLEAAISFACKYEFIGYDEKTFIPKPPEGEGRDRWLKQEEAADLLSECMFPPDRDAEKDPIPYEYIFAVLGLHTAARKDAILSLTWGQVDFEREVIHYNVAGRRRTKKRRASVPMSATVKVMLEMVWDERGPFTEEDPVLGTPKDRRAIAYRFKKACQRAGLTDVTPHTLRHTYGTWAAQRGVPIWKIAGVMGDTVKTTAAHYLHHCPDELRDAV